MKICRSSSHFRFNQWFEKTFKSEQHVENIRNLCNYFWLSIGRLVSSPIALIILGITTPIPNTLNVWGESVDKINEMSIKDRSGMVVGAWLVGAFCTLLLFIYGTPIIALIQYLIYGVIGFEFAAVAAMLVIGGIFGALVLLIAGSVSGWFDLIKTKISAAKEKRCPMIEFI